MQGNEHMIVQKPLFINNPCPYGIFLYSDGGLYWANSEKKLGTKVTLNKR